jgi:hypothetical protein
VGIFNATDNVVDNVLDTSGIANVDESPTNSGLAAGYGFFGEPSWLYGNSDSAALTETDMPVTTDLFPSAGGSVDVNGFATVDGQFGFTGFTDEFTSGFAEMTTHVTDVAGFTGTNWSSFTDRFAGSNGFNTSCITETDEYTTIDGFTGADVINQLASADGPTGAGGSTFSDAEVNDLLDIDMSIGADWVTGNTRFTEANGFTAI